jgi:hypothetical protein
MKEEYVFPHNNWYLKFEECDRELVDNWRINIIKYSNKPCPSNYINCEGDGGLAWGGFMITIDQFKQYVLNIEEPIINNTPEDLSYLIDLFKQQQIT